MATVNVSAGTAILIDRFSPSAIIFTGVADGNGPVKPNYIVIGNKALFYDFGITSNKGFSPLPTYPLAAVFGVKNTPKEY